MDVNPRETEKLLPLMTLSWNWTLFPLAVFLHRTMEMDSIILDVFPNLNNSLVL